MKLKRKVGTLKLRLRKHKQLAESKQIQRLRAQRNKDLKEAARLTKLAAEKEKTLQARMKKQKAKSKVTGQRNQKLKSEGQKALGELKSMFGKLQNYANSRKI